MDELEKKIFDAIVKRTKTDASTLKGFDENTPLFAQDAHGGLSMNLDSLDGLELNLMLREEWKIETDMKEMHTLKTIKAIADYVRPYEEKKHG